MPVLVLRGSAWALGRFPRRVGTRVRPLVSASQACVCAYGALYRCAISTQYGVSDG